MTTVEAVLGGAMAETRPRRKTRRGRNLILRLIDVTAAGAALIFFLPTLILIALAVRAQDGGPALFRQQRIGQGGRPFACLKFRSMVPDAERRLADVADQEWAERRKLRQDPRVTPLGRLLRLSSLDELPQLLNVLAGDMSLVGPRPIVAEERALYSRRFAAYCLMRPGLGVVAGLRSKRCVLSATGCHGCVAFPQSDHMHLPAPAGAHDSRGSRPKRGLLTVSKSIC